MTVTFCLSRSKRHRVEFAAQSTEYSFEGDPFYMTNNDKVVQINTRDPTETKTTRALCCLISDRRLFDIARSSTNLLATLNKTNDDGHQACSGSLQFHSQRLHPVYPGS